MKNEVNEWKEKVSNMTDAYMEHKRETSESYSTLKERNDKIERENEAMKKTIAELEENLKKEKDLRINEVKKIKL